MRRQRPNYHTPFIYTCGGEDQTIKNHSLKHAEAKKKIPHPFIHTLGGKDRTTTQHSSIHAEVKPKPQHTIHPYTRRQRRNHHTPFIHTRGGKDQTTTHHSSIHAEAKTKPPPQDSEDTDLNSCVIRSCHQREKIQPIFP